MIKKTIKDLKPNDIIKSCPYLEHGIYFAVDGARTCVNGTVVGRILATPEEINGKTSRLKIKKRSGKRKVLQRSIRIYECK